MTDLDALADDMYSLEFCCRQGLSGECPDCEHCVGNLRRHYFGACDVLDLLDKHAADDPDADLLRRRARRLMAKIEEHSPAHGWYIFLHEDSDEDDDDGADGPDADDRAQMDD